MVWMILGIVLKVTRNIPLIIIKKYSPHFFLFSFRIIINLIVWGMAISTITLLVQIFTCFGLFLVLCLTPTVQNTSVYPKTDPMNEADLLFVSFWPNDRQVYRMYPQQVRKIDLLILWFGFMWSIQYTIITQTVDLVL